MPRPAGRPRAAEADRLEGECRRVHRHAHLRGLTRRGQLFSIAKNALRSSINDADRSGDEFAGSTFSPDGRTLFVNIQAGAGMSFAIWGDWRSIGV